MIGPEKLNSRKAAIRAAAKKFYDRLKKRPPKGIESLVTELDATIFAETDCLKCANCCKTLKTVFKIKDIDRIASALQMKPEAFIDKYLEIDEEGEYVQQKLPCAFLDAENACTIYEYRPWACRHYPHTGSRSVKQSWDLITENTAVCPAVYEITQKLQEMYDSKKQIR